MKDLHDHSHPLVAQAMKNVKSQTPVRIHEKCSCASRGQQRSSPIETLEPPQRVSNNREMLSSFKWNRLVKPPCLQRHQEQRRSKRLQVSFPCSFHRSESNSSRPGQSSDNPSAQKFDRIDKGRACHPAIAGRRNGSALVSDASHVHFTSSAKYRRVINMVQNAVYTERVEGIADTR